MPTLDQTSAGGVAFRRTGEGAASFEVALILVGPQGRWQLPKGLVNNGETPEAAALREVAEETGVDEARWVRLEDAPTLMSFASERKIVEKAAALLAALPGEEEKT